MSRIIAAGVVMATSGALLIVALLLDWWDYPGAFDDPASLPESVRFLAEAIQTEGQSFDADAFRFFGVRDILWLSAGVACFGFGLLVLATRRVFLPAALGVGALITAAFVLIGFNLIWPLDYRDLGPKAIDLGADLPLAPDIGAFIALVAALAGVVGAAMALASSRLR